ncbi:MAG: hypothetical protein QXP36_14780 [Conexivisphaerales archaeon]
MDLVKIIEERGSKTAEQIDKAKYNLERDLGIDPKKWPIINAIGLDSIFSDYNYDIPSVAFHIVSSLKRCYENTYFSGTPYAILESFQVLRNKLGFKFGNCDMSITSGLYEMKGECLELSTILLQWALERGSTKFKGILIPKHASVLFEDKGLTTVVDPAMNDYIDFYKRPFYSQLRTSYERFINEEDKYLRYYLSDLLFHLTISSDARCFYYKVIKSRKYIPSFDLSERIPRDTYVREPESMLAYSVLHNSLFGRLREASSVDRFTLSLALDWLRIVVDDGNIYFSKLPFEILSVNTRLMQETLNLFSNTGFPVSPHVIIEDEGKTRKGYLMGIDLFRSSSIDVLFTDPGKCAPYEGEIERININPITA